MFPNQSWRQCAGNMVGNEKKFYDEMSPMADREFGVHLERLKTNIHYG